MLSFSFFIQEKMFVHMHSILFSIFSFLIFIFWLNRILFAYPFCYGEQKMLHKHIVFLFLWMVTLSIGNVFVIIFFPLFRFYVRQCTRLLCLGLHFHQFIFCYSVCLPRVLIFLFDFFRCCCCCRCCCYCSLFLVFFSISLFCFCLSIYFTHIRLVRTEGYT